MKNTILAVTLLVSTIAFSQMPSQKLDIGLLEGNRFKVFSRTSNKITQIKDAEWVTLDKIGYDGKNIYIIVRGGAIHETNEDNTASNPKWLMPQHDTNTYWEPRRGTEDIIFYWEDHKGEDSYIRYEFMARQIKE